jgi:AcrR family transcriptional regulator
MSRAAAPSVPPPDLDRGSTGRPLDATRDDALRQAALELIAEIGYDRLTIDAVAARVKASKATLYRRWNSKAELVADAFTCSGFKGVDTPDTGDLRSDLLALSAQIWMDTEPVPRATLMAGMFSAMLASPELRDALNAVTAPPAVMVSTVIQRAVERGEIPVPEHLDSILSVMPGICMFRLVKTGTAPDRQFFESVIDGVILPALHHRADPARHRLAKKGHR